MTVRPAVKVGCASGFWGDSSIATPQLLQVRDVQYLVYDYLAETTMSILARARARRPELGYATDFVDAVVRPHLAECLGRGIRLVANAGGLNPEACRAAVAAIATEQGLRPRIAVVTGDDLMPALEELRPALHEIGTGRALPDRVLSVNAYLGARPIAAALASGADVVITGRCVDSALLLGPLVHEHGWAWDDWHRLAAGTLAGHVVECGAQATGGLFTDWEQIEDWSNIGYPIVECAEDGSFVVTKPPGTGGLVVPGAVAEQIVYEIGDPGSYAMPDVVCDFRDVEVRQVGPDRVRVSGARGRAPGGEYKVSVTYQDGHQLNVMMAIRGIAAEKKAQKTAEALLDRTRRLMSAAGLGDYAETVVEHLGCESQYGPHRRIHGTREVVLRIGARHAEPKALRFLQREAASAGTSMGPGTKSHFGGRAEIQPVVKLFSTMIAKRRVEVSVDAGPGAARVECATASGPGTPAPVRAASASASAAEPCAASVPLVRLAYARSGDKGDDANIGVIARRPEFLPVLRQVLTADAVRAYFAHLVDGEVERFDWPGLAGFNFVLHRALGGGGMASVRSDPLGKAYAQMLLDMPVPVPARLLASLGAE